MVEATGAGTGIGVVGLAGALEAGAEVGAGADDGAAAGGAAGGAAPPPEQPSPVGSASGYGSCSVFVMRYFPGEGKLTFMLSVVGHLSTEARFATNIAGKLLISDPSPPVN